MIQMVDEQQYEQFNEFYNSYYYCDDSKVSYLYDYFVGITNNLSTFMLDKRHYNNHDLSEYLVYPSDLLKGLQLYDFKYGRWREDHIMLYNDIFILFVNLKLGTISLRCDTGLDIFSTHDDPDNQISGDGLVFAEPCLITDTDVFGKYLYWTMTLQPRKSLKLILDFLHDVSKHNKWWYKKALAKRDIEKVSSRTGYLRLLPNRQNRGYVYSDRWSNTPTPRSTAWYRQNTPRWEDIVLGNNDSSTDVNYTIYADDRSDSA